MARPSLARSSSIRLAVPAAEFAALDAAAGVPPAPLSAFICPAPAFGGGTALPSPGAFPAATGNISLMTRRRVCHFPLQRQRIVAVIENPEFGILITNLTARVNRHQLHGIVVENHLERQRLGLDA